MKKIVSYFLLISLLCFSFPVQANEKVQVFAVVGTQNRAPIILEVIPNSNPRMLKTGKTQSYSIYFQDYEKDKVHYTITPENGFVTPPNGEITQYDSGSGAYIHFLYLAPEDKNPQEFITVTLNDGISIEKRLNLYIY